MLISRLQFFVLVATIFVSALLKDSSYFLFLFLFNIRATQRKVNSLDLLLLFIIPLLNPDIFIRPSLLFTVSVYVSLSYVTLLNRQNLNFSKGEITFISLLLVNSLFISWNPLISVNKVIGFSLFYIAIKSIKYRGLETAIDVFVVFNVALLFFGFGYVAYDVWSGQIIQWRGVLVHPNALGYVLALFWAVKRDGKRSLSNSVILVIILILLVKSGTRGALLAIVLFEVYRSILLGKQRYLVAMVSAIVILFMSGAVQGFVLKRASDFSDLGLVLGVQRLTMWTDALYMALSNPLGIGMGIDMYYDEWIQSDNIKYWNGIPVSASTEKGNILTGMLVEYGIPVTLYSTILFFYTRRKQEQQTKRMIVVLLNMFEFALFSMGLGAISWLIIGYDKHNNGKL